MSRKRPANSPIFLDKWRTIEEAVVCAFDNKICRYSYQSVHQAVFQACQDKFGDHLLHNVRELFLAQCSKIAVTLKAPKNGVFLEEFVIAWERYFFALQRVSILLLAFRNYLGSALLPPLQEIGELIFCDTILRDPQVALLLKESAAQSVGIASNWEILCEYGRILMHVDRGSLYPVLEGTYLDVVRSQFAQEAEKQIAQGNVESYLKWVEKLVYTQEEQIAQLLTPAAIPALRNCVLESFVGANELYLLSATSGCAAMVSQWNFDGIREVIKVFDWRNCVDLVVTVLIGEIANMANNILKDGPRGHGAPPLSADSVIQQTLKLLANCDELSTLLPQQGNSTVETSPVLKVLFKAINNSESFPDKLSLYYDARVRQANSDTIKQLAEEVLLLLRVLRDREGFELSYRNHLAARIMHGKPATLAMEAYFIDRLQEECGSAAVSRVKKMISDVRDAPVLEERLKNAMAASNYVLPIEFHVTVLTAGFWPQYSPLTFTLPDSMRTCAAVVQQFYTSRHNGRKLQFQLSLGDVKYTLRHNGKTYVTSAPTPFVCVLESLNKVGDIFVADVSSACGLPREDIVAQVAALAQLGLITAPAGNAATTYRFNSQFSSKSPTIRVGAAVQKTTRLVSAVYNTGTSTEGGQTLAIDCAIIKLLKEKKEVDHDTLCVTLQSTLDHHFKPTIAQIKERIDANIEKGFFTRGQRSGLYVYSP